MSVLDRLLLVVHTLLAMTLLGACTHQVVVAWRALKGQANVRLLKIYSSVGALTCFATVVFGALVYPAYRVEVRGKFLDACAPLAARLFEVKEDVSVFALIAGFALWASSRELRTRSPKNAWRVHFSLAAFIAGAIWFNATSGLWITLAKAGP